VDLRLVSTQQAVQADKIQLAELVPRHFSQLILPLNRALAYFNWNRGNQYGTFK